MKSQNPAIYYAGTVKAPKSLKSVTDQKSRRVLSNLVAEHLDMNLVNERGAFYHLEDDEYKVHVRFLHRAGKPCLGKGHGFTAPRFYADLKKHSGYLLVDTADFTAANPEIHLWAMDTKTTKALYKSGLLPQGRLSRKRFEMLRTAKTGL